MKNFRATLFLRASASCSKILNIKSIFNTCSEKFQDNSLFQGKCKMAKNSNIVKNVRASSVFLGKRKLLKNPARLKKFQYSVYSLGGYLRNLG